MPIVVPVPDFDKLSALMVLWAKILEVYRAGYLTDQQANQVLSLIEEVGQNATAVTLPIAGATGGTLTFTMPSAVTTIFTQTAGAITVNEGSGAVALTNSRVLSSGFSANNLTAGVTSGTVRVQFTLSYVNNSGRSEYNYTKNYVTSVTIRR